MSRCIRPLSPSSLKCILKSDATVKSCVFLDREMEIKERWSLPSKTNSSGIRVLNGSVVLPEIFKLY